MENFPSRLAAMAMTWAAVTAPCPPSPDIRMFSRFLIMLQPPAPEVLCLLARQLFLRRCFPFFLLGGHFREELLGRLADVFLVREPFGRLLRVTHLLEAFHAVLADLEDARRVEL